MGKAPEPTLYLEKRNKGQELITVALRDAYERDVSERDKVIASLRSRLAEYEKPVTDEEWSEAIVDVEDAFKTGTEQEYEAARTALATIYNRLRSRLEPSEDVKGLIDRLRNASWRKGVADAEEESPEEILAEAKRVNAARQALSDAFASRDARIRELDAKRVHTLDLYDSLGVKWGDDPFSALASLKARVLTEEELEHIDVMNYAAYFCTDYSLDGACALCTSIRSKLTTQEEK